MRTDSERDPMVVFTAGCACAPKYSFTPVASCAVASAGSGSVRTTVPPQPASRAAAINMPARCLVCFIVLVLIAQ
ncbi:hypothetical protein BGV71_13935 [Burkholderia ubonensis]|nr:hypothetical protein BGV71_13935 [Burkholderia ubonensis]